MPLLDRLRSHAIAARAFSRLVPHAGLLVPAAKASASRILRDTAARRPDHLAIICGEDRLSYHQLDAHTNQWAHFFRARGVGRGDVVALMMDNRPEYAEVLLALNRIGAITACINTHATGKPLAHAFTAAHARLIVAGSEHAAAVFGVRADLGTLAGADAVCVHADRGTPWSPSINSELSAAPQSPPEGADESRTGETMAYLYTSGTTGLPKAATVTNLRFLGAAYGFGLVLHECGEGDVIYSALPLYHGTAQWGGFGAALATGATLALRRKFSASAFWEDVHAYGATHVLYVGELCRYLLNQPAHPLERAHHVRVACGNGLRKDVWEAFQKRFNVSVVREFYGATEGNAPMANLENRPGMIGRLGPGQVLLECNLETGEPTRDARGRGIRLREAGRTGLLIGRISPLLRFDGYTDEGATSAKILSDVFRRGDAYFDSGDLLTLHEDDWVSFADRVGDTYRWKGENVSTNEVAEILNGAPGVLDSTVYGVAVPGAEGRAGMAALATSPEFDLAAFARHVKERLPSYQRPHFIRLQTDVRTTSTFKHKKVEYRAEGYDPSRVQDPLYTLGEDAESYVPVDAALYESMQKEHWRKPKP